MKSSSESSGDGRPASVVECDVLVIGSGAAGLAAAARLKAEGVSDVLVLTESLKGGTSINTGSDKQTYYKLGLCGDEPDSPVRMARTYTEGGAVHGDIALVEAALSARCFSHLCDIGVPFPHDAFGQYAGYKTDHDPARRATSVGPYTSREMCLRLLDECRMRGVRFAEGFVAVRLLTAPVPPDGGTGATGEGLRPSPDPTPGSKADLPPSRPLRCIGAIAEDCAGSGAVQDGPRFVQFLARDTVFATGGPGGLYSRSVYPSVHLGGIGLALAAGARARNLPLSQFGLASTGFRWNVSGTYMQALPRFVSTASDGVSDARDFLLPAFGGDPAAAASAVFLKGYQWPFDAEKAAAGSSRIDLLVREETAVKGRRVFLDFRSDTPGLDSAALSAEARAYLEKSGALAGPPIARLLHMNPGAAALYREHGTDLEKEPLEIALCAQHNNGGLAADAWWQSENVAHLWPVGEVNGSHGVRRPGGSALNAGQVGAFRAAEAIAHAEFAEGVSHAEFAEGISHAEFAEAAEDVSHAEFAEAAEDVSHAEFAEAAEGVSHAEFAEAAEGVSHAEFAEAAEGCGSGNGGFVAAAPSAAAGSPAAWSGGASVPRLLAGTRSWRADRRALQERMDDAAGPVRSEEALARAAEEARAQLFAIRAEGFAVPGSGPSAAREAAEALRTETLCLASVAYLEACLAEVRAGVGSRGSAIVASAGGEAVSRPPSSSIAPEDKTFRAFVQTTELLPATPGTTSQPQSGALSEDGRTLFGHAFVPCRPIPAPDDWFENVWRDYRTGLVFPS